jgi:ribulose 1,5-bisphosphate carboxylase large subunit-like protein
MMNAVEVMTAVIGGIFGLLSGVSLRIIDTGDNGNGEE